MRYEKTLDYCFLNVVLAGVFTFVLLTPGLLSASELRVHYQTLEKLLLQQVFNESGRRYLNGDLSSRCNYAYLENPRVMAQADRLRITAHFSARAAVDPHMLRHACGFKLANDGHDTRAIQHYLGHKNIQHTVRYTELAADRFNGFWED